MDLKNINTSQPLGGKTHPHTVYREEQKQAPIRRSSRDRVWPWQAVCKPLTLGIRAILTEYVHAPHAEGGSLRSPRVPPRCSRTCDFTHSLKFSPHQCSRKQEYSRKGRKKSKLGVISMMAPLCHSMSLGFLLEEKTIESAKIIVTWRNGT